MMNEVIFYCWMRDLGARTSVMCKVTAVSRLATADPQHSLLNSCCRRRKVIATLM